jgi:hypothetical protein
MAQKILSIIDEMEVTGTITSETYDVSTADSFSAQCTIDVTTPTTQTYNAGYGAFLATQGLEFSAAMWGSEGETISITFTAGATAGAEVVTVNDHAITVQVESGVSTRAQVKTALDASAAAMALVSVLVGSAGTVTAAAAQFLTDSEEQKVNVTANTLTLAAHGFATGLKVRLDGPDADNLPGGLAEATDYYIINVDANTVKFASSYANALAGTAIDLTTRGNEGVDIDVIPQLPTLAGGAAKLQWSNDGTNWVDDAAATNITADGTVSFSKTNPAPNYYRLHFTCTEGQYFVDLGIVAKGSNPRNPN